MDKDGRMTCQEFTIAVHLVEAKLKGIDLPKTLPGLLKNSTDPNYHGFSEPNIQMPLQPIQTPYFMNGSAPMYGMPLNMGMQMAPSMGMQNVRMSYNMGFPSQMVNQTGPTPQGFSSYGPALTQTASLGRNSSFQSEPLTPSSNTPTYNYSKTLPINKSAFDSLALDKLTDLSLLNKKPGTTTLVFGDISSPIRLRYAQMFKTADVEKFGFLTGMLVSHSLVSMRGNYCVITGC